MSVNLNNRHASDPSRLSLNWRIQHILLHKHWLKYGWKNWVTQTDKQTDWQIDRKTRPTVKRKTDRHKTQRNRRTGWMAHRHTDIHTSTPPTPIPASHSDRISRCNLLLDLEAWSLKGNKSNWIRTRSSDNRPLCPIQSFLAIKNFSKKK